MNGRKLQEEIMTKVDLITGFLGAGKTTFIKKYADYFIRKGEKISIIENEFGGIAVDAVMLKDQACDISQLSGGCMCCTGRVEFENMLLHMAAKGYDRVLVEPSGIYDVDEFFEMLLSEPVKNSCEIGSILTIADAQFNDALSDQAQYLMFSQLLSPGKVILSKTQMLPDVMLEVTVRKLNGVLWSHGSSRTLEVGRDVIVKDWDSFDDEDFAAFAKSGYQMMDHQRAYMEHASAFTARVMADYCKDKEHLEGILRKLFKEGSCGQVLRVKGHISDVNGNWYEINASESAWYIEEADVKRGLFIVIGQEFDEQKVRACFIPRSGKKK